MLYPLSAALLLLGLIAFLLAALVNVVICDSPGCGDGRTVTTVELGAATVVLWALGVYAFVRAQRAK